MKVKFSCKEISQLQEELADWMEDINMQAIAEERYFNEGVYLSQEDINKGYDLLMANLWYLEVLKIRLENLRCREINHITEN